MNLVFLGAPGSGKGTYSTRLEDLLSLVHISTGDIFRAAIKNETEAGKLAKSYIDKGMLVPDEVTIKIVEERLEKDDCKVGVIFDGFPRTINQASSYDEKHSSDSYSIDKVIYIDVSEEILASRITNRRVCPKCGASYHLINLPSKVEGICDKCGSKLEQRKDDNIESLKVRLTEYHNQTSPLIDYYTNKNKLVKINGEQSVEKVLEDILKVIK